MQSAGCRLGLSRLFNVIASEAKQSTLAEKDWIASSLALLAMTKLDAEAAYRAPKIAEPTRTWVAPN